MPSPQDSVPPGRHSDYPGPDEAIALGGAAALSALVAFMAVWFWSQGGTGPSERAAAPAAAVTPAAAAEVVPARHDEDGFSRPLAEARRTEPASVSRAAPAPGRRRAPESAGLVIITEPPGARVTVNGIGWGATPITLGNLGPGTKRVRVSLTGYESAERVVGADTSRTRVTLRIELRAVSGARPAR